MLKLTLLFLIFFLAGPVQAELFHLKNDGTVADLGSGLLWQGNSKITDSAEDAALYCQKITSAGYGSWRLPSSEELSTLEQHLDQMTPATYWVRGEPGEGGGLYCFGDGASFTHFSGRFSAQVRCVANDPQAPAVEAFRFWANAWKTADIAAYLASYIPGYQPSNKISHDAWVEMRKLRLTQAGNIQLFLSPEDVRSLNEHQVEVIFKQIYKSNRYHDKVRKRLLLEKGNGRWLIAKEEQLASLPQEELSAADDFY